MTVPQDRIRKEMGITHAEFFRNLSRALGGQPHSVAGSEVRLEGPGRRVRIAVGPEGERRLSPIVRLPVTVVELNFEGYSAAERDAFVAVFDLAYFKGGG